jgi:tRNA (guanine-N7-)-methyltransferase
METFERVFQPPFEEVFQKDHHLKGRWGSEVFHNDHPLVLELGCGKGEYTLELARRYPERNYLGVDIKGARMWRGARTANDAHMGNVAFLRTRIEFIRAFFARDEVEEIWITFPDPQLKQRRRKKRLTGSLFLNRYRDFLTDGGIIHLKTDNAVLYSYTLDLARYNHLPVLRCADNLYGTGWNDESVTIRTTYESRFFAEGSPIRYIQFRLPSDREIKEITDDNS